MLKRSLVLLLCLALAAPLFAATPAELAVQAARLWSQVTSFASKIGMVAR